MRWLELEMENLITRNCCLFSELASSYSLDFCFVNSEVELTNNGSDDHSSFPKQNASFCFSSIFGFMSQ